MQRTNREKRPLTADAACAENLSLFGFRSYWQDPPLQNPLQQSPLCEQLKFMVEQQTPVAHTPLQQSAFVTHVPRAPLQHEPPMHAWPLQQSDACEQLEPP